MFSTFIQPAVLPFCTWDYKCSPGLCSCRKYVPLHVWCPGLGLYAFNVNGTRNAAQMYAGLYVLSWIMLLPRLCVLNLCYPSLGFCSFDVYRTRCAALLYVGLRVHSRIVLLPEMCALDVWCPGLGLCAFDVNRTRCDVRA